MAPEICVLEIKGLKSVDRDPLIARVAQRINIALNKRTE
jgi:hypothetical protein